MPQSNVAAQANGKSEPDGQQAARAELRLNLPPAVLRKLEKATQSSYWTMESLIERWATDHLHSAYLAITYRRVEIAPAGTYRAFDAASYKPALGLTTARGQYQISVQPHNPSYQKWVQTYQARGKADPEGEAREMCLYQLRAYLEEWSTEPKIIYPDDFLVQQIGRP